MARRIVDLDRLTAATARDGALEGRSVTVLGLARSGIAMARFFADNGARVTVYDGRTVDNLRSAIDALDGRPIELELGPDVDPAGSWAHADLVATSPSINPDFPTAEPRLRAALAELVAAHRADPLGSPALVSEPDLVLRMCPCPTIGVTGTKGKTTTSSLIAALLAQDPAHPAILGGNIGIPLIERLPELTPEHRVVIELSELQLPTLSRGTTVAVYTNVTSDHLDRHGSLASYRAVKRRLAELADPAGALVLNAEDPVVAAYSELHTAPVVTYRRELPLPGGLGIDDGWIVASGVRRLALAGGGAAEVGPDGRIMPVSELAIPGAHNVSNALAAVAAALLFGLPAGAIRRAAAAFVGVEHRLEQVANVDGVRFINDSQGTQPDAVIAALRAFPRPLVLIAGGATRASICPVSARWRRRGRTRRADRRVGTGARGALPRERRASRRDGGHPAGSSRLGVSNRPRDAGGAGRAAGRRRTSRRSSDRAAEPAAASFDMFADYAARGAAFRAAAEAMARRRAVVRSRR